MRAIVFVAFSLVASTLALTLVAPPASACHQLNPGTPTGTWSNGAPTKTEVVGAGAIGAGVYTEQRTTFESSCGSSTYATFCSNNDTPVSVPSVGTPDVTTPDVRVLGQTVVPSQTVPARTLFGGTTVTAPAPACVLGPADSGVYVEGTPAGPVFVGTGDLVWPFL